MVCIACSCENDPRSAACRSCGAEFPAATHDGPLEARIAEIERRLAGLAQQFAVADPMLGRAGRFADAAASVWKILESGSAVRIDASSGAGATTLLTVLEGAARERTFKDGAIRLTDVVGPAPDIVARLGAPGNALILLDRAELRAADLAELCRLLPSCRFAIVQQDALPDVDAITLPALTPAESLVLLNAASARSIDAENARVAIDICKTVDLLPGPVRLIGHAAREMQRSFISLGMAFDTGDGIVRGFVASRSAQERRLLEALAVAGTPLGSAQIAYVTGDAGAAVDAARLVASGLVCADGGSRYELPGYVARIVAPSAAAAAIFARLGDVFYAALEPASPLPLLDRQLLGAERFLRTAFERSQWGVVVTLGPRLAQAFALRGSCGASGRVMHLVEAAQPAEPEPQTLPAPSGPAPSVLGGEPAPEPAQRGRNGNAALLLVLALAAVALLAFALRPRASPLPAITQFSTRPDRIVAGASSELCVDVTGAAVVEIFPHAARLPGTGRTCVAVHPWETTRYIAVATSADGRQVHADTTVDVRTRPTQPAIATFAAFPARIRAGQSTRLCYAVTGANLLRVVPRIGSLTSLRSCQTLTLPAAHRYTYELFATADDGRVAMRQARVDVVPDPRPVANVPAPARRAVDPQPARAAVYQFDSTPSSVERGQAASLCVGVERSARAYVTHLGPLSPGITRCYRVLPRTTTVYSLYVALGDANAVETVTIAVRPARRHDVARLEHH